LYILFNVLQLAVISHLIYFISQF